jgi:hypothetical protein
MKAGRGVSEFTIMARVRNGRGAKLLAAIRRTALLSEIKKPNWHKV